MAKKDSTGRGRPRPAAGGRPRPSGGARPRAGGASYKPPSQQAQPTMPPLADAPADEVPALEMTPLQQADAAASGGEENNSATAFFAMPAPKRAEPEPPPAPAPPPPPSPSMAGMPGGGMPPQPMPSMAGMSGGMGIKGPVAGAPMPSAQHNAYIQGPPTLTGVAPEQERAQSYRVFGLILGFVGAICLALVLTMGLVVAAVVFDEEEVAPPAVVVAPPPAPRKAIVDTGAPKPKPVPTPRPRAPNSPSPSPRLAPVAPAPAAAPVGPATATISMSGANPFTGIEINCPMSSFRQRASFSGGSATVAAVPAEDCKVTFKGGPPATNSIRGGQTKSCSYTNGMAVCG